MNKKETIIPIIVAVLTVIFVVISVAVFLSKGRSKFWLSKKMKIGALLLTFTAVTQHSCITSCYDAVEPPNPRFRIHESELNLNLDFDNSIYGKIEGVYGTEFSFNITDTLHTDTFQIDNIAAEDGSFDSGTEYFFIKVDKTLQNGTYFLNLYSEDKNNQSDYSDIYRLNIR